MDWWFAQSGVDIETLADQVDLGGLQLRDYLTALGIVLASLVIGRIVRMLITRTLERRQADRFIAELIGRVVSYLIGTIGLVYGLEELGVAIGPALGALGIFGIALAFAVQDVLENFVSGVLLQLRRPFTAGDEVETSDYQGTVVQVDSRAVVIHTPAGETVRIPSATVIKQPIVNLTARRARRTTIVVGVAYGTSLAQATQVLTDALGATEGVLDSPAPDVMATEFGDSSINFAVRYWHEPSIASMWRVRHAVVLAVDEALASAGITIPFPQRVLHLAGGSEPDVDDGATAPE